MVTCISVTLYVLARNYVLLACAGDFPPNFPARKKQPARVTEDVTVYRFCVERNILFLIKLLNSFSKIVVLARFVRLSFPTVYT